MVRFVPLPVVFGLLFTAALPAADPPAKEAKPKFTNRLAQENSPYLLQHAHNPVDWYPWGAEAFDKAKKEGKLVFLSIGYSSCHWCHVMERESFANPEVAKIMNKWFVCIKVDREERPDIDNIYMTALQVFGNGGGWPLSMFLTAEGKPIVGGTYWPPEDKEVDGRKIVGVKTVMTRMHEAYADDPKRLNEQADTIAKMTVEALARTTRGIALIEIDRTLVDGVLDAIKEEYDATHGGFTSPGRKQKAPKFPTPPFLELLQQQAARPKSDELAKMLANTLDHMAQGGIYDQLGGGFHRYSTDRSWTVPHFEKMLYDNAQLVEVYARAHRQAKNPLYKKVVQDTLGFIAREMTSPEGAFFSALDADSSGAEGRFYVWTDKDLEAVLTDPAELSLLRKVYGTDDGLNFEDKYYILVGRKPLAEVARELKQTEAEVEARVQKVRQKLFDVRSERERPFLDTKVLTAWNGQMIAGYAVAGQELKEPKYIEAASRAADFLLKTMRTKEGRLLRTYGARPGQKAEARLNGYLDDYAFLVHGLLCLHDATGDKKWLTEAKALTDTMVKFHLDKENGGFFYTSSDHEKLFARAKDQYDGAQPAANSVAVRNLVRLWSKTGEDQYRALAEKTFKAFAAPLKSNPAGLAAMAQALALYLEAGEKRKKE